jgi:O-antigen ligase
MNRHVTARGAKTDSWADELLLVPAALLMALAWLLPNHQPPWLSFHHEIWMAAIIVMAAVLIGWQTRWRVQIPAVAVLVLCLALVPFAQYGAGLLTKHGAATVASFYLLLFFAALVIGCSAHDAKSNVFWRLVFVAIAVGALLNVAAQLIQWQRLYNPDYTSFIGFWISGAADPSRPFGSLMQPNHLATFLVWGLVALLWLYQVGEVRWPVLALALPALAFGVSLTQSRAGMLELLVLTLLAAWIPPSGQRKKALLLVGGFTAAVIVLVVAMPTLTSALGDAEPIKPRNLGMVQDRLKDFQIFAHALAQAPWFGYGLGNLGPAFLSAAVEHPDWYVGRFTLHSHNLFFDFLLWFGLPLGLLLIVASLGLFFQIVRNAKQVEHGYFYLAMVMALAVHAMVELPHQYLHFLAPVGLFMGYLVKPVTVVAASFRIQKLIWIVAGLVGVTLTSIVALDYLKVQERYTEWRFENERVGNKLGLHADDLMLLQHFADELAFYNTRFHKKLDPETQRWLTDTALAANTAPAFFDLTVMLAINGRTAEAQGWMHKLNAINSQKEWVVVDRLWRELQEHHSELQGLDWPPLPQRQGY